MEQEFRQRLEAESARLLKEIEQLGRLSPIRGETQPQERPYGFQREDDAMQTIEWEKRLALEKSLRGQLAEMERALAKFDTGRYGLCEGCGQPIDPERLRSLPQARLCISCKGRQVKEGRGR